MWKTVSTSCCHYDRSGGHFESVFVLYCSEENKWVIHYSNLTVLMFFLSCTVCMAH